MNWRERIIQAANDKWISSPVKTRTKAQREWLTTYKKRLKIHMKYESLKKQNKEFE
jgi:hypothetical protein